MRKTAICIAIGISFCAANSRAQAQEWGAIAVGPDGGHGAAVNAGSRSEAEQVAMDGCRESFKARQRV